MAFISILLGSSASGLIIESQLSILVHACFLTVIITIAHEKKLKDHKMLISNQSTIMLIKYPYERAYSQDTWN